ncbi:hypothetical protein [Mycolicibacillus trivialis]
MPRGECDRKHITANTGAAKTEVRKADIKEIDGEESVVDMIGAAWPGHSVPAGSCTNSKNWEWNDMRPDRGETAPQHLCLGGDVVGESDFPHWRAGQLGYPAGVGIEDAGHGLC